MPPFSELKKELRFYRQHATSHRLYETSKWIGELAVSITKTEEIEKSEIIRKYISENVDSNSRFDKIYTEDLNNENGDKLELARNLYDLREFKKSSFILRDFKEDTQNQSHMFMFHYNLWIHGDIEKREKRYHNEYDHSGEVGTKNSPINLYANNIYETMKPLYVKKQLNDLNCYLFGLALKEKGLYEEAVQAFTSTLNQNPLFWTAWLEICSIINKQDLTDSLAYLANIENHWMKNFYFASLMLEYLKIHETYEKYCFGALNGLFCFFRESVYILNQIAHLFYFNQEQSVSLELF